MASHGEIAPGEAYLPCVHCGLCLEACPTYLETRSEADSPRGRIYLIRAIQEGRAEVTPAALGHLDLCLGCRACEPACPSGVQYGSLIERARPYLLDAEARRPVDRNLRRGLVRALTSPWVLARVTPLLRLTRRLLPIRDLATSPRIPLALRRLLALVPDPEPAIALPEVTPAVGEQRGTVAFMAGCVAQSLFPRTNELTVRLLALAGFRVLVPRDQVCCGALAAHQGLRSEAERLAARNVAVLRATKADWIVPSAAGCGAQLREYDHLAGATDAERWAASRVAERVRDATELLADADLPLERPVEARVAYHHACHLAHAQGVRDAPSRLLERIPGLVLVPLAESDVCCGSAGTYNLTERAMAGRLGDRKARNVVASGATIVAAANPGCVMQIRAALRLGGSELTVAHPIELVARSCGLTTPG